MDDTGFVYGRFFSGEPKPVDYSLEEIPAGADTGEGAIPSEEERRRREAGHVHLRLRRGGCAAALFWLGYGGLCKFGNSEHALPDGSPYIYGLSAGSAWPNPVLSSDVLNPLLACLQEHPRMQAGGRLILCAMAPIPEKELAACRLYHIAAYSALAPRLLSSPAIRAQGFYEKAVDTLRARAPAFTALAGGLLSASHFRKFLIEGKLAGRPLRMAFNGPEGMARFYSGVIFSQTKCTIRPLLFGASAGPGQIDIEARWLARSAAQKPGGLVLPSFCRSILGVGGSFGDYIKSLPKSALSDIQKIETNGFEPAFSRDFLDLLIFYHSMYLPMLGARHREHSFYLEFAEIARYFDNGFILFVKRGKCPVAGMVSVERGGVLWGKVLGIAAGSAAHTQAGANSAVVYFMIKYAYDNRLGTVDMGYSSPFRSDGVLRFKSKWGTKLVADRSIDYLCLDFKGEEAKRAFFSAMSPLPLESLEPYDPPDLSSSV